MQKNSFPGEGNAFVISMRILWGIFCAIAIIGLIDELINVTFHPEDYEYLFNSEATSSFPNYASQEVYVRSIYMQLPWFLLGLITCFNWKSIWFRWGGGMHFIVSLALITKNCSA